MLLALTGCGSSPNGSAPSPTPGDLNGNWSLAGARTPATYPLLATTLNVQGNQITGQGTVQMQCGPAPPGGLFPSLAQIGGILPLSGQIASNGTFTATSSINGVAGGYTVSITGTAPTGASPSTWTGTYTINASLTVTPSSVPCTYSHSSSFTPVPITPFNGTYNGPASNGVFGSALGSSAAFTVQVTQGPATLVTHGATSSYQLPLSATIAVTGSSCFTSGTTVGAVFPSEITGDALEFHFAMNDGSDLVLSGFFNDLTESTLNVTWVATGGTCSPAFNVTTLTRH